MVDLIRASAAEHGRSIDEDHYGATVFSGPSRGRASRARAESLLRFRPELAEDEHVAFGADATRELLERFIEQGATKFVLVPLAADPAGWLRELFPSVVAPLEERGAYRSLPAR